MSRLVLSKTRMGGYLKCPQFYWFNYESGLPKGTDYARLLGVCVHSFIASLYDVRKGSDKRFKYKDIKSARGAWFYRWNVVCDQEKRKLRFTDEKKQKEYGLTGWICIMNYWNQNYSKPDPVYIEERVQFPLDGSISLLGIFDQIRSVDLDFVKRFRPDLIVEGGLKNGHDLAVIVDLKTNKESFAYLFGSNELDWAAQQFELHEDIQVNMYHWLYWKWKGKMPIGFFWYHLRSKKWVFSYRTIDDFETLYNQVRHIADNLNAESFPKSPGKHCRWCDYFDACGATRPSRPLAFYKGENDVLTDGTNPVETGIRVIKSAQRRLKLIAQRVKAKKVSEEMDTGDQMRLIELPNND